MQGTTEAAIQELISQDGVEVSRGVRHDWVLEVAPEVTTDGPAMDPVEVWADHNRDEFRVRGLPHAKDGWDGYTADRRED